VFLAVPGGFKNRLFRPDSSILRCSVFQVVAPGYCQTTVNTAKLSWKTRATYTDSFLNAPKSENNHYPLLDALRARGGFAGGGYGRPALVHERSATCTASSVVGISPSPASTQTKTFSGDAGLRRPLIRLVSMHDAGVCCRCERQRKYERVKETRRITRVPASAAGTTSAEARCARSRTIPRGARRWEK
jgi:hypothetical protein